MGRVASTSMLGTLTQRVRTAHGDAWELQGRLREPFGGGAARVRGARLMASGLPQAKWNNADVTDADVDLDAITAWYGERRLPWGLRVPLEFDVDLGRLVFVKRCIALLRTEIADATTRSVHVRRERAPSSYIGLEAAVFDSELDEIRGWVEPQFSHPAFRHWVAEFDHAPAAIATTIQTRGDAGPAAYLTGLAAVPGAPSDALPAIVRFASLDAFSAGAEFVHTNPTDEWEIDVLSSCGGIEVPGFRVRIVES